jgi:glucokinase
MSDLALGIDIGGTKVAAAIVDGRGTVLASDRGPVAPESNEEGLASICAVVDRLLAALPEARERLGGIGAGAPGAVDWQRGVLRGATNLRWRDLPLADALRARYGLATVFDNDVNVAAWGERWFGASRAPKEADDGGAAVRDGAPGAPQDAPNEHLVFITVGTGIGSGLIEAGRIVRGRGGAGEIGHIPLFEDGPRCRCGLTGCLEALAAGPAFAAAGQRAAAQGAAPVLLGMAGGDAAAVTAELVVRAAVAGDAGARNVLDREGYYLALAVLIAGRMLDPEVMVIGGGVAEAGELLFDALWTNLARLRPRGPAPQRYAIPARLGPDAGAIGAAALVLRPEPGFTGAGLIAAPRA